MPDKEAFANAAEFSKRLGKYWSSVLQYAGNKSAYKSWCNNANKAKAFYTGKGPLGTFFGFEDKSPMDFTNNAPILKRYNKVHEFVRVMTPELYYRNPTLTVNARNRYSEDGPMVEEFAKILRDCVNYHYDELDFITPRKHAVVNYLLAGRGILYTCPKRLRDDTLVVREQSVGYNDFLIDPDAKSLDEVTWMGHRCRLPKAEFIRKYGKDNDRLYSAGSNPNELIDYVMIYTRLGLFGGLADEYLKPDEFEAAKEKWGDYVKIVLVPEPYYEHENKRPDDMDRSSIPPRVIAVEKWEAPFWRDTDPKNRWPYTLIDAHYDPDSIFPIGPVSIALGEATMINWAATYLAMRQKNTTREVVGLHPGVDEATLEKLQNAPDMTFIRLPLVDGDNVGNAMTRLSMEADLTQHMNALQFWINEFNIRTGLAEALYISDTQSRSAEDAAQKGRVGSRVIDGLFSSVENAMNLLGRKHAFAWRFLANTDDVEAIVGPERAAFWESYQPGDYEKMARNYAIQILGDTIRRPNKAQKQELATLLMENLTGLAAQVGDLEAINSIILNWQEEMGVPDWKKVSLSPPPPPPEPEPAPPAPAAPVEPTMMMPPEAIEGTSVDIMPGEV